MPGIGVISNRNARVNRLKPGLKDQLAFIVGSNGEVSSTGKLSDVTKALETFRRIGVDMIAISGGDGTSHKTIEIVLSVYQNQPPPPILLLPTGTQNMIPRSFGIAGNGLSTLLLAIARYQHNVPMRCIKRNILKVNEHHSFMFGCGTAARFMIPYYESGETNPIGAAKMMFSYSMDALRGGEKSAKISAPIEMEMTLDDGDVEKHHGVHTFFCSFVERLPLHFVLFPRAGRDEGVFEIAYTSATPAHFAKALPYVLMGTSRSIKNVNRRLARKLKLRFSKPEPYTLDGDLYDPCDSFDISAGPELLFVVPDLKLGAENPNLRYEEIGPWGMRYLL
ncbi:MAG: diacylglycerol kinase family protein [Bradymonadales bacterium]